MKQLIACAFLVLFSFQIQAQESHSPAYKCSVNVGNGKLLTKYILLGNEFEQIDTLDFSDEAAFVSANEYMTGGYSDKISKIKYNADGDIQTEQRGNEYSNSTESFSLINARSLVHTVSILDYQGQVTYEFNMTYTCAKQSWVD